MGDGQPVLHGRALARGRRMSKPLNRRAWNDLHTPQNGVYQTGRVIRLIMKYPKEVNYEEHLRAYVLFGGRLPCAPD